MCFLNRTQNELLGWASWVKIRMDFLDELHQLKSEWTFRVNFLNQNQNELLGWTSRIEIGMNFLDELLASKSEWISWMCFLNRNKVNFLNWNLKEFLKRGSKWIYIFFELGSKELLDLESEGGTFWTRIKTNFELESEGTS